MAKIHHSAVVDSNAELAADVEVGPLCVVGPHVRLGQGCRLKSHVVISGHTTIGSENVFFPGCVIGDDPQDVKFRGEPAELIIGDKNTFREHVTAHIGTAIAGNRTVIGNHNLIMVQAHVGHDCVIDSYTMLANGVQLAGHCRIEQGAIIGGGTCVHQFVTIGKTAYVGGGIRVKVDMPPFIISDDDPARPRALNLVGLRRQGYSAEQIAEIEAAWRLLARGRHAKPLSTVVPEALEQQRFSGPALELLEFYQRRLSLSHGRLLEQFRQDQHADKTVFYRQQEHKP